MISDRNSYYKSKSKSIKKKSKSIKKSKKSSDYNLPNRIKYFYEMTLKNLSTNKDLLQLKDKNIIYGKATMKELLNMPWMFNVKPLWSSVQEPYFFELSLTHKNKNDKIDKFLSIHNGNIYLIKDKDLNSLV
jgi:hypothetical protein